MESFDPNPDTITGIKASDIDFDGDTDLLITGTVDSKEKFWIRLGGENHQVISYGEHKDLDDNSPDFTIFQQIYDQEILDVEHIEKVLGSNFTVEDIEDWFVGNQKNGDFESYAEAYKKVIDFYENATSEEFTYKLIYFDEDDIPEFVSQRESSGGLVSVYVFTFNDGYLSKIIDGWHYDGNANNEFRYKDKGNLIINVFGTNPAYPDSVEYIDSGYGIIDGKMKKLYYRDFDDKKNGKAEFVYNKKLTEEQRESLNVDSDVAEYVTLKGGDCSCEEIFQQLENPGFKVE